MSSEMDDLERTLAELESEETGSTKRRKQLGLLPILVGVVALAGFGGILYYVYDTGVREGSEVAAPILIPEGPVKIKPEDPGGLDVPHRDKTVYSVVENGGEGVPAAEVETLLPPPEDPMRPPPPEEPAVAQTDAPPIPSITEPAAGDVAVQSAPAETGGQGPVALVPRPSQPSEPALPSPALQAPQEPATLETAPQQLAGRPADEASAQPAPAEPPASRIVIEVEEQVTQAPSAASRPEPAPQPSAPPQTAAAVPAGGIAGSWRVQISALRSREAAEAEWNRQKGRHPDLLGNLSLQVQEVDITGKGTFYRVRGGPLADKASADALCEKLKAQKLNCIPVRPGA